MVAAFLPRQLFVTPPSTAARIQTAPSRSTCHLTPASNHAVGVSLSPYFTGERVGVRGGGTLQRWHKRPPLSLVLSPF